jgi:hypothetical protein
MADLSDRYRRIGSGSVGRRRETSRSEPARDLSCDRVRARGDDGRRRDAREDLHRQTTVWTRRSIAFRALGFHLEPSGVPRRGTRGNRIGTCPRQHGMCGTTLSVKDLQRAHAQLILPNGNPAETTHRRDVPRETRRVAIPRWPGLVIQRRRRGGRGVPCPAVHLIDSASLRGSPSTRGETAQGRLNRPVLEFVGCSTAWPALCHVVISLYFHVLR